MQISADVPKQRLKAIEAFIFDENSKVAARKGMRSQGYSAFSYNKNASYVGYWHYSPHAHVVVVALGPDGIPRKAKEIRTKDDAMDYLFPDDCRILLLPAYQPRTKTELQTSTALAAILTPVTVASDIVLVPVALFVRIATGNVC
jgi:hypothetical protein